jgi:chorismate mutase
MAVTFAAVVLLSGCTVSPSAAPPASPAPTASVPSGTFDATIALIVERLDTGDDVAASKWFSGAPVVDAAREKAVLDAAAARAAEVGADPSYVAAVFTDQITASKEIQQALLDSWHAGRAAPPASAPDLATQVRPVLDRITTDLVPALGTVAVYRDAAGCGAALNAGLVAATPPTSAEARAALATATAHLCTP